MIGSGRASIAEICEISRANVADGSNAEALHSLKSLGAGGKHQSNQERDLHRWLEGLHSMRLKPFTVELLLNVSWNETLLSGLAQSEPVMKFYLRSCPTYQLIFFEPNRTTYFLFPESIVSSKPLIIGLCSLKLFC